MLLKDFPDHFEEYYNFEKDSNIKEIVLEVYKKEKMIDMVIFSTNLEDKDNIYSYINKESLKDFIETSGYGECEVISHFIQTEEVGNGSLFIYVKILSKSMNLH